MHARFGCKHSTTATTLSYEAKRKRATTTTPLFGHCNPLKCIPGEVGVLHWGGGAGQQSPPKLGGGGFGKRADRPIHQLS